MMATLTSNALNSNSLASKSLASKSLASNSLAAAGPAHASDSLDAPTGVLQEIRFFWQQFIVAAFDPYRPELHYMRGPGPACRAKDTDFPKN